MIGRLMICDHGTLLHHRTNPAQASPMPHPCLLPRKLCGLEWPCSWLCCHAADLTAFACTVFPPGGLVALGIIKSN